MSRPAKERDLLFSFSSDSLVAVRINCFRLNFGRDSFIDKRAIERWKFKLEPIGSESRSSTFSMESFVESCPPKSCPRQKGS